MLGMLSQSSNSGGSMTVVQCAPHSPSPTIMTLTTQSAKEEEDQRQVTVQLVLPVYDVTSPTSSSSLSSSFASTGPPPSYSATMKASSGTAAVGLVGGGSASTGGVPLGGTASQQQQQHVSSASSASSLLLPSSSSSSSSSSSLVQGDAAGTVTDAPLAGEARGAPAGVPPFIFREWEAVYGVVSSLYTCPSVNGQLVYGLTGTPRLGADEVRATLECLHEGTTTVAGMKCRTCAERAASLVRLRGPAGSVFQMPEGPVHFAPLAKFASVCAVPLATFDGIVVFKASSLYEETVGGFPHFNVWASQGSEPSVRGDEVTYLVRRYLPLMVALMKEHGVPGIHASLDVLLDLLPKVNYGSTLSGSASWFRQHIVEDFAARSPSEQHRLAVEAIVSAPYARGDSGPNDYVLTAYHQVKNTTLMLLSSAHSVSALAAMTERLLSPENYERRTKEPSESSHEAALRKLGSFTNTLMTVQQAVELHGALVPPPPLPLPAKDGPSGSASSKKSAAAKFAARTAPSPSASPSSSLASTSTSTSTSTAAAGSGSGSAGVASDSPAVPFVPPTSVEELLRNLPRDLEIFVDGVNHFVAAAETTLDSPDTVLYPWLWSFYNGFTPADVGLRGWVRVSAILPIPNGRSWIFACAGAKVTSALHSSNFCIESFLAPSCRRDCGPTFAKLNKETRCTVPSGTHDFVIGVGACVAQDVSKLIAVVRLRSQGTDFTLTHG